jgi:hypothetical protein
MSKTEFSFPHGNVSHDVADILTMFGNNRCSSSFFDQPYHFMAAAEGKMNTFVTNPD